MSDQTATEVLSSANVVFYDAGARTLDQYTAVYLDMPEQPGMFTARAMSNHPFHPQGFGQIVTVMDGRHLGKKIQFNALPSDCQQLVINDLSH